MTGAATDDAQSVSPVVSSLFRFPRLPFTVALGASVALVAGSVVLASLLHLAACPLCIVQRMLYMALGAVAAVGLATTQSGVGRGVAALGMTAIAGTGAFTAGYQSWLQLFAPETGCTTSMPWWERFVDWAGRQATFLFRSNGLCSDPAWKFLGLSLAEWSLIAFLGLMIISALALFRFPWRR